MRPVLLARGTARFDAAIRRAISRAPFKGSVSGAAISWRYLEAAYEVAYFEAAYFEAAYFEGKGGSGRRVGR